MIGQNTLKGRKTRSKVAQLEAAIWKLKTANAILQEDKEELRRQKDSLASRLHKEDVYMKERITTIREDYSKQYSETMDLLRKYKAEVSGLKVANGRLKDIIFYAAAAGVVAGLLLAPYITNL